MISLHYLEYEVSGFKGNGVYVRTDIAWVRVLGMVWKWVGVLQNLVFGSFKLMACPKSAYVGS